MILLASNSHDPTIRPVLDELLSNGIDVVTYFADEVVSGKVAFSFASEGKGRHTVRYGDRTFLVDDIHAAWIHRGDVFLTGELDSTKAIYLDKQRRDSQAALWYAVPEERWLNAPSRMHNTADSKHYQMQLAEKMGFIIPKTVISNNWDYIFDNLEDDEIVLKMPYGVFYNQNQESRFLPTTIVKRKDRKKLSETIPFPGIWQEYVPKKKEWRITVVGDEAFGVAIYTTEEARDDWRKRQFERNIVDFKVDTLPLELAEKCVGLLKEMQLGYGAFDIIEKPDGAFVFLEVNIKGQYQWVVDELDLPIPQKIASELMNIANRHE